MVDTNSTEITAKEAGKSVSALISGGVLREKVATLEVAAADDDGSTYRFFRVHSSDRVSSFEAASDAITAGTSFDFGLYDTEENGGAVVDADMFASAVDLSSASGFTNEATADIAEVEQTVWERLGLSSDPGKDYDVVALANTVGSAAGTIAARMRYLDGT